MSSHDDDDFGRDREEDTSVITKRRLKRPPMWRVLFHNDDYTSQEFVVMVLMRYFHKTHAEATKVMLHVHMKGMGIAGVYTYDVARTKLAQTEAAAREQQMPLRLSIEPDDPGGEEDA